VRIMFIHVPSALAGALATTSFVSAGKTRAGEPLVCGGIRWRDPRSTIRRPREGRRSRAPTVTLSCMGPLAPVGPANVRQLVWARRYREPIRLPDICSNYPILSLSLLARATSRVGA